MVTLALTDLIEADLLTTLDGGTDPQDVLDRYAGSKGPLYAALARATAQATARFGELRGRWTKTQAKVREGERAADDAEKRAGQAERRLKAAEKDLARLTSAVERQQALLDEAARLRLAGFDEGSLPALGRAFAAVAKTEGTTPADAAARFVQAATDFEGIAGFEKQAREAETRAKKAEADAEHRQRNARVRSAAIAWAEWFVRRGITEKTIAAWEAVGKSLGLTAENLAEELAGALRKFGSLDAACRAKTRERDALAREVEQRKAGIAKLKAERDRISAALDAVADEGADRVADAESQAVAAVAAVRDEALVTLREATASYAKLTQEAAALKPAVRFAQALTNPHEMLWLDVTPEQWAGLMRQFGRYLGSRGDAEAPPTEAVSETLDKRLRYPYGYGRVRLTDLVDWLVAGLYRPIGDRASLQEVARRYLGDGRG